MTPRSSVGQGKSGEDRRGVTQGGPLGGREPGELLGQPGVAALAVGQHGRAAGVGDGDHDLAPRKASGRTRDDNWSEAAAAIAAFAAKT